MGAFDQWDENGPNARDYATTKIADWRFTLRGVGVFEFGGEMWAPKWAINLLTRHDTAFTNGDVPAQTLLSIIVYDVLRLVPIDQANRFVVDIDLDELRCVDGMTGTAGVRAFVAERCAAV